MGHFSILNDFVGEILVILLSDIGFHEANNAYFFICYVRFNFFLF